MNWLENNEWLLQAKNGKSKCNEQQTWAVVAATDTVKDADDWQ